MIEDEIETVVREIGSTAIRLKTPGVSEVPPITFRRTAYVEFRMHRNQHRKQIHMEKSNWHNINIAKKSDALILDLYPSWWMT